MASDAVVLGTTLVTAGLAALVAGPVGMVALGLVVLVVGALFGTERTGGPDPRNCPDCGAPNGRESDTCEHCGSRLPVDAAADG